MTNNAVIDAASSGDRRALLIAMRDRIAKAVGDLDTPPRDLAALSKRLIEVMDEIDVIDHQTGNDAIGKSAATPDEAWDDASI